MNEKAKEFINNIGLLCEQWTIVFRSFKNQGLSDKDALMHTQAFMSVVLNDIRRNGEGTR